MANKRANGPIPDMPFSVPAFATRSGATAGRTSWVYRSDVSAAKDLPAGSTVGVTDARESFWDGLYSSHSQIAVRMISASR